MNAMSEQQTQSGENGGNVMSGEQKYDETEFKEYLTIQGTPLENANRRVENPEKTKEPKSSSWLLDVFLALIVMLLFLLFLLPFLGFFVHGWSMGLLLFSLAYSLFYIFTVRLKGKTLIIKVVILLAKAATIIFLY